MKRLSIALAAVGLSVSAFAALPAATDPTLVAVPQFPGGFFIGGSAYYLQATASANDLAYGFSQNFSPPAPLSNLNNTYSKIDTGYDWAWGLNGGYIFPGTGNDLSINYLYMEASDSNSTLPVSNIGGTSYSLLNPLSPFTAFQSANVEALVDYRLNQVDVTFGQFMDVGCRLILHPNTGLRWLSLQRKLTTSSFVSSPITGTTVTGRTKSQETSDFNGIGPIVGLDASYYVGYGFGVVGHADAALLIGTIDTSNIFSFAETLSPSLSPNVLTRSVWVEPQSHRIIPATDLKLGANYTWLFNNGTNYDFTLEAGWQFSQYFNAVDRTYAVFADLPNIANIDGRPTTTSSVGFQGPYINLTFHA